MPIYTPDQMERLRVADVRMQHITEDMPEEIASALSIVEQLLRDAAYQLSYYSEHHHTRAIPYAKRTRIYLDHCVGMLRDAISSAEEVRDVVLP